MSPRVTPRALVLAVVIVAAVPATACASTIAGSVGGGKLPAGGKGQASVRAVNGTTLVIEDATRVRSGRYNLKVPAGNYLLFAATTPFRGRAGGVDLRVGKVAVRAGKRKTLRVSLRKRKRRSAKVPKVRIPGFRFPGVATARAAFVPVKYPAVWIQRFEVSGSADFDVLRKGIPDMLITDIIEPLKSACGGAIVEREHLAEILGELALQQRPEFDPATRVPTGRLVAHNREVTGRLSLAGDTLTLSVKVTNVVTGNTRSFSRSTTPDRFFELELSVVQETVRLICGGRPPAAYSGQASGETSVSDSGSFQKLSWNGNVRLRLTGELQPESSDEPDGEYALYEPESGSIRVILDGTTAECTYHGETTVTIVPEPGRFSRVQHDVDAPAYSLAASFPLGAAMPVTTTGPAYCAGGTTTDFPLAGRTFLGTQTTQRSSSTMLTGTTTVPIGPITNRWDWSLAPQAN